MDRTLDLSRGMVAVIDNDDFDRASKFKWHAHVSHHGIYARTNIRVGSKRRGLLLHRFLTNCPREKVVDHRNHNGLDNRRANLRICDDLDNRRNRISKTGNSKFKGVSWHTGHNKWQAYIRVRNNQFHLGYFSNEEDASIAYNTAAQIFFGEFVYLNAP